MKLSVIRAKINTDGVDISGDVVTMDAGTTHIIRTKDLPYYQQHSDAFEVVSATPALLLTDASGNVTGLEAPGVSNRAIYALADPLLPTLLIGGDHPYQQWWGTNGSDGMAAWYNANGIKPYMAINTQEGSGTTPGGNDQMSWAQVRELIAAGRIEAVGHGERHYQDNTAPTSGFTVTYTGPAATATFQITGGNAVGTTAGAVADFSFSLSSASYDTLAELATAISAVSGWSCSLASELSGSENSINCLAGSSRSAKNISVDWPVGGGLSISYAGTTYASVGLQIDSSNLKVYGDGRYITGMALSGSLSTIISALNAVSGVSAALAGQSSSPNYVQGTETGTNLAKWAGMLWLSATPIALEAGLSSGYLRYRNNAVNKSKAASNGVTLTDFAQSGGFHYEQNAEGSVWRMQRGNSIDSRFWFPMSMVQDFIPHISVKSPQFSTVGRITAVIDALADSRGFGACLLMHKVLPDGSTGYSLPTSDTGYYDQTESDWNTVIAATKAKIDAGSIRQMTFEQMATYSPRSPVNWLFNPKFRNSGESMLASSADIVPGWQLNLASGFSQAGVSNDQLSLTLSSASTLQPIYQAVTLPPGTWEFSADIEIDGYSSGNGVSLMVGRSKSRAMPDMISGLTNVYESQREGNSRARLVFEMPANVMSPGQVISSAGPFNLSTTTNIWLYVNGQGPLDNINCAAGAASSSAVTSKEVATAINAAIAAAGWSPEYHTVAKAVGTRVVITSPYIADQTSYVEIRAAGSSSATGTIFGSSSTHYGKPRLSSGDWRSGSWIVGLVVQMNSGATLRIARPMLRRTAVAVR